jgi:hypothetical protein
MELITKKSRHGWIRIVEASVAILIVAGIVLIVLAQNRTEESSLSSKAYSAETSILREIQLNNSIRDEIIGISELNLPVEWDGFANAAPLTKSKINESIPAYLECIGKICSTDNPCLFASAPEETIYAESVVISSNLQTYSPKVLKLFCWEK